MFDTSVKRIFYYAPQHVAVEVILRPILAPNIKLISVDDWPETLLGHVGGAFVLVSGHPDRLPKQIDEILRVQGFLIIDLDDRYARTRALRTAS